MSASSSFPSSPSSSTRPDKAAQQKEYRDKEGECFERLRRVIKDLTGTELRTRYEVLSQAIQLLSGLRREQQLASQANASIGYYDVPQTNTAGYPGWQSSTDFGPAGVYDTTGYPHNSQNQAWPGYHQ